MWRDKVRWRLRSSRPRPEPEREEPFPDSAATPARPSSARAAIVLAYGVTGLAFVLVAGLTTKIYQIPLQAQLGLFQLLPATYWIGLSLMAIAAILAYRSASDVLIAVTGAMLLATLAGTPSLFEPTPRYWDSYMHFAQAQQLTWTGHLMSVDPTAYSTNWPGAFLTMWTLSSVAALPAMDFLGFLPFLTGGITFLAMFELLRSAFPPATARAAAVPTALFAVWAQYHASPQALGFVLALLVLATFRRNETRWRIASAGLFVGLVVSHPTSAILILTILGVFALLSFIPRLRGSTPKETARREARFSLRVAITFATVWLAWLFFLAAGSSEAARIAILARMDELLSVPEQTLNLVTARTVENLLPWAPRIRTVGLGLFGLFGLVSLLLLFRDRNSRGRFRFVVSALVAAGLVAAADIFAFGGQFYDRSMLMIGTFLPALCFAGLTRLRIPRTAKHAIVVALVTASVATASTAYYLEAFNLVPSESIAGASFLNGLPSMSIVMDGKYPDPVWLDPGARPNLIRVPFSEIWPTPIQNLTARPLYAVYDPTAELWYRQWYGVEVYQPYSDARANFSRIYDNGWSEVYWVPD